MHEGSKKIYLATPPMIWSIGVRALEFRNLCWNGFLLRVPWEARLVREGGNAKTGSMRIEAESYFFEVKWEEVQPKKIKPLSEVVSAFIEKLEKESKRKIPFRAKRQANVFNHDALFMSVKTDVEERVYFWYCEESLRVMTILFAFRSLNPASRTIMKQVLDSIRCHGEETNLWTVLETEFEVPSSFLLTERKLMVGRTHLLFLEQKFSPFTQRRREILFDYFSMANVQFESYLKDLNKWVEKWYLKDLKKRYRGMKFEVPAEEKISTHIALIKKGRGRGGFTTRKFALYTNVTWYCEDLNRIYSVTTSEHVARPLGAKLRIDEETFEDFSKEFISKVKCH